MQARVGRAQKARRGGPSRTAWSKCHKHHQHRKLAAFKKAFFGLLPRSALGRKARTIWSGSKDSPQQPRTWL